MREEIEAAALFITRLVNKNLSSSSSASSTHSSASSTSSSASSTSSESPPNCFDEQTTISVNGSDQDKVEQFRQSLMKALYDRFHNHWFPEQPTKGQAYRCIRLNEWDRHDETLQQACLQCGIDYKDLQLPVELTLWVDPEEVTCRFGENKGSHCLVAKFKDGELKDNNFNIDISDINIEIFRETPTEKFGQTTTTTSLYGSPDYNRQHNQYNLSNINNSHNDSMTQNSNYHFLHQNGPQHHSSNNHHHNHQHHQAQQHHRQHQSNLGKPAILPSYQNNYLTENPIYYYFN